MSVLAWDEDLLKDAIGRILERICVDEFSGCWLWTGSLDWGGYGRIRVQGQNYRASRLSALVLAGLADEGLCVLHKCDEPSCVNPSHLFFGTYADNMADCLAKGRRKPRTGEANPRSLLDAEKVRAMRADRQSGLTYSRLGRKYGVSEVQAGKVCRGEAWAHV